MLVPKTGAALVVPKVGVEPNPVVVLAVPNPNDVLVAIVPNPDAVFVPNPCTAVPNAGALLVPDPKTAGGLDIPKAPELVVGEPNVGTFWAPNGEELPEDMGLALINGLPPAPNVGEAVGRVPNVDEEVAATPNLFPPNGLEPGG